MSQPRVLVVGAGIIGLATAYHLVKGGARVTIIDRDPAGDKASWGNAGGIAVTEVVPASAPGALWRAWRWMLDPLGPVAISPRHAPKLLPWLVRFASISTRGETERIARALAAINSRVYDDLVPLLSDTGLADQLHRHGALSLYESHRGYRLDAPEWTLKRAHGIVAHEISGHEARAMEPDLGPLVCMAVFTPQWSYVRDPKRLLDGLRDELLRLGVTINEGEVRDFNFRENLVASVQTNSGTIAAEHVVVAAGAWSGQLAERLVDSVLLESERGYNTTVPDAGVRITRQLIFAERKFVATPLQCGLRIGGAAEFAGLAAAPNYKRSQVLVELARRYLPGLQTAGGTRWAGHRPTTPDSLPVIGRSPHRPNVFYAFGHGHLGLTQAATTGRLVSDCIFGKPPLLDLQPYSIERFA